MYRKMLVPLDASEYAECTLSHAKEVADAHKISEIVLLNVVEPPRAANVSYMGPEKVEEFDKEARESAAAYLQKVRDRLALGSNVKTVVIEERAAEGILDYIEKNGVDLVIMSTHGRSGPSKWFLGSVAERVVRRSPVPVFLIPSLACRLAG